MARKQQTLADVIRKAIEDSGLSVYAVAKRSGVSQPVVHRFASGERDMTLETADKVCRFLGLKLVQEKSAETA